MLKHIKEGTKKINEEPFQMNVPQDLDVPVQLSNYWSKFILSPTLIFNIIFISIKLKLVEK